MDVTLRPMADSEFPARRAELVRDTALSLAAYHGLSVPEAEAQAQRATAASLPDGPATRGHLLRTAVADGRVVGWIWLSLPGTFHPEVAWVSDVAVDEAYRSRGAGRAVMLAGEAELAARGIGRAGLNVDGGNDRARRLYDRLGYAVTRQQWSRALTTVPAAHDVPATLGPDGTARIGDRPVGRAVWTDRHRGRPGRGWLTEWEYGDPVYGAAILAAVEAELVHRGAQSLGTEVAGDDHDRRLLVQRLGFRLLAQQMEKPL